MPIFKYTIKKYMKATSTWVIVGISMLLVFVIGGYLPWHYFSPDKNNAVVNYGIISIALVSGITSFLAIFTSVFAGFKSAAMFKDEVEDGTFLVMLSKPVTRSKIIFFKWVALQATIAMYTLIVALTFFLAIIVFDKGHQVVGLDVLGIKTLKSQSVMISLALWGILFVVSLIFSSVALLLSTKLSVGTTIGISIALGVIIPITSLVGTFTAKQAYYNVSSNNPISLKSLSDAENNTGIKLPNLTDERKTLYNLGVETKEHDAFKFAQIFDLNYQIQTLSEFASDQAIPESLKGALSTSREGMRQMKVTNNEVSKNNMFVSKDQQDQIDQFNALVVSSWETTEIYRQMMMQQLQGLIIAKDGSSLLTGKMSFPIDSISIYINRTDVQTNEQEKRYSYTPQDIFTLTPDASKPYSDLWSLAMKPFASWQTEYKALETTYTDPAELLSKQREMQHKYYMANVLVWRVSEAIAQDGNLLKVPAGADSNYISMAKKLAAEIKLLVSPINFWIEDEGFKTLRSNNYKDVTHDFDDNTTATLGVLGWTTKGIDTLLYGEVVSAVQNDFHLVKIHSTDYTSKYTLLWIYLALALGLVPVSYFVVRKQDFR